MFRYPNSTEHGHLILSTEEGWIFVNKYSTICIWQIFIYGDNAYYIPKIVKDIGIPADIVGWCPASYCHPWPSFSHLLDNQRWPCDLELSGSWRCSQERFFFNFFQILLFWCWCCPVFLLLPVLTANVEIYQENPRNICFDIVEHLNQYKQLPSFRFLIWRKRELCVCISHCGWVSCYLHLKAFLSHKVFSM